MTNSQLAILPPCALPVIPVVDLLDGVIVRAVGGHRDRYLPIESPLVRGSQPLDIAAALSARVGHRQLYLADLDAIGGSEPAWDVYGELLAAGFDLWLDAGLSSVERAMAVGQMSRGAPFRIIAALESLPDFDTLAGMLAAIGPERLVFSLDLADGRPLTAVPALQRPPLSLVEDAVALGVRRVIVLDVAAVGKKEGPLVVDLCREIHARWPTLEMTAGGGVRGADDLAMLRGAGCIAALASSWLHERCD